MNLYKAFKFKKKEVIGYIEHYNNDSEYEDVKSVDIYLSNGCIVNMNLKDQNVNVEDLEDIFEFDSNYWDSLHCEEDKSNSIRIATSKSEVKSTYNPYE